MWRHEPDREEIAPELDVELQRIGARLRQTPVPGAEFDLRVMAAIRRSPSWRARGVIGWWLRPRLVPVSPFAGLAAVGAIAAVLFVIVPKTRPSEPARSVAASLQPTTSAASNVRVVRFVLAAPGATRVELVGDFNRWSTGATPLRPVGQAGVWTVDVPLAPGRHEYAFVVDDREWRPDPSAPLAPSNEYGTANSVITVEAHSS